MRNGRPEMTHGVCGLLWLALAAATALTAQDGQLLPNEVTFNILVSFDGNNGNSASNMHGRCV